MTREVGNERPLGYVPCPLPPDFNNYPTLMDEIIFTQLAFN